jgi:hypothetical protein
MDSAGRVNVTGLSVLGHAARFGSKVGSVSDITAPRLRRPARPPI